MEFEDEYEGDSGNEGLSNEELSLPKGSLQFFSKNLNTMLFY